MRTIRRPPEGGVGVGAIGGPDMRVLVAFERSGVVRRAFAARGHEAWSVDTQPAADGSAFHVEAPLDDDDGPEGLIDAGAWDLIIAHPPCTYLCSSGLHWNRRDPSRGAKTQAALDLVRWILDTPQRYALRGHAPVRVALENPVGAIGTQIRPADQYIQPYEFGEDASKRTGLWLVGLPRLIPTCRVPGRLVTDPRTGRTVERWANQTDSGQNRLGPSPDRADRRAETYPGIAAAMAAQWGA